MTDFAANMLGALALAVTDRIEEAALQVMHRAGETPAALVVIGYGSGPSNDRLRRVLGLSHPGTVRLVDRLVSDGLVERRQGKDKRAVALYLTKKGEAARRELLDTRLTKVRSILHPLSEPQVESLSSLLHTMLAALPANDQQRRQLCRLCDNSVCSDCPIPADLETTVDTV